MPNEPQFYDQDGLRSLHNHDFMQDSKFIKAYDRGVKAAGGLNYNWHWRVHTCLWAARHAYHVEGDYVECGVNVGFMGSAIMTDLNWNETSRKYYLLDTYCGADEQQLLEEEVLEGFIDKNKDMLSSGFYVSNAEQVRENFKEWAGAVIVEGRVPETLTQISSDKVAFLHIDMNNATPEVAALEYLWPKLSDGAMVLLDDYAYYGYHHQKYAMDSLTEKWGVSILSLPTGQGLLVKPPQKRNLLSKIFSGRLIGS
ncbi:class I SAM-dependent methyltransferase [Parasedimentitalea maritima]|uniref:Class I SAM-dependent methyltransferase n=1 Tax=Parasedimentitalea maritima TaxID=2578117 RepID=A0ABY2USC2_9RHOB|nr:TylF/MycF/NovP-related O-methyltransferase [Zongyanglinia marina]TLP55306.1 class I SAM-dependent methyltransferase [Zongyanglinia marina]